MWTCDFGEKVSDPRPEIKIHIFHVDVRRAYEFVFPSITVIIDWVMLSYVWTDEHSTHNVSFANRIDLDHLMMLPLLQPAPASTFTLTFSTYDTVSANDDCVDSRHRWRRQRYRWMDGWWWWRGGCERWKRQRWREEISNVTYSWFYVHFMRIYLWPATDTSTVNAINRALSVPFIRQNEIEANADCRWWRRRRSTQYRRQYDDDDMMLRSLSPLSRSSSLFIFLSFCLVSSQ